MSKNENLKVVKGAAKDNAPKGEAEATAEPQMSIEIQTLIAKINNTASQMKMSPKDIEIATKYCLDLIEKGFTLQEWSKIQVDLNNELTETYKTIKMPKSLAKTIKKVLQSIDTFDVGLGSLLYELAEEVNKEKPMLGAKTLQIITQGLQKVNFKPQGGSNPFSIVKTVAKVMDDSEEVVRKEIGGEILKYSCLTFLSDFAEAEAPKEAPMKVAAKEEDEAPMKVEEKEEK